MYRRFLPIKALVAVTFLIHLPPSVSISRAAVSTWSGAPSVDAFDTALNRNVGAVTLRSNGIIGCTAVNGGSELVFESSSFVTRAVANLTDWTGPSGADGTDRLFIATDTNVSANNLRFLQSKNDPAANFASDATIVAGDSAYEIVPLAPVPEPATWTAAAMTLLAVAASLRRRFCRSARPALTSEAIPHVEMAARPDLYSAL